MLRLKTEYLVKRKLVLFNTKELGRVPSIGMSTLYSSSTWSVHTYI